ncbi:MAG TPA: hypothetical protein VK791_04970 [bacterium]|nr:hypothetical protein [bacterium]
MKYIFLTAFLFIWVPFFPSCTKSYSLSPLTTVNTPTATPACNAPSAPAQPASGIYWIQASIQGSTFTNGIHTSQVLSFYVSLLVNGVAESTDTVIVTGPGGLNVTLPYTTVSGTSSSGGAEYQIFQAGTLVPGGTYVITTTTSAGTASATLTAPGGTINLAADGSTFGWTQGGQWNTAQVSTNVATSTTYSYQSCSSAALTTALPSSAYPSASQEYGLNATCSNFTTSVTNGVGLYEILQSSTEILNFPNVSSPSPTSDIFTLNTNLFDQPIMGALQINFQSDETGLNKLAIFDAAGNFKIITVSVSLLSLPSSPTVYTWDGKDRYGLLVPDGMYFVYLAEPTDPKFLPVLVER